jgi:hypothetical protein
LALQREVQFNYVNWGGENFDFSGKMESRNQESGDKSYFIKIKRPELGQG